MLDEPTNDLDSETLELLEELVSNYSGTLLLVSHDRAFLNNVVTSTLVFEGDGNVKEYAGGYDDYIFQRGITESDNSSNKRSNITKGSIKQSQESTKPKKLNFNEQRELDALPLKVDELELTQTKLHDQMATPDFYKQDGAEISNVTDQLLKLEKELAVCYERWEELEARL